MRRLTEEEIREGMVVKLTHPDPSYHIGAENPVVGSEWECRGVVRNIDYSISVLWSNGRTNAYDVSDLSVLDDYPEECTSIW